MVLSGMLSGLLIDCKFAKKADLKFGHAAFVKNGYHMDLIDVSFWDTFVWTRTYSILHVRSNNGSCTQQYKYVKLILYQKLANEKPWTI